MSDSSVGKVGWGNSKTVGLFQIGYSADRLVNRCKHTLSKSVGK